ncbi:hypothetical protein GLOIN_2v1767513 [Rhizophagus irregularis DAOM 181602=DAOM 197198]|uniref:Uncharacterized protein n=1 Tax=Rhizophagus irregularis (strain DAOM 181602 / DAOM 197198 / MUCL 43194) TaxID=747089 RepID=A0A2P4QJ83_RHIID|nr:hypothetical protein GLOIN_2v1767513 [Rhizophagus irregularis DAOM 181602=DAOM 197198]POG77680.1 hypothetical protein GLOIN_2v1767513 [Rhizophagus irregularis DAOM 181602=DAOM 197198]GBC33944.2 hypothetical protein GLOIN_2v1767513 [Rhizophagus irregularis DAOM 181602=DAOM 197198]CAG8723456.1 4478_t:CDS:2 [Rhizophagus irregularis]|eukprot:XP_025184546.1 hypothetical protein GLOIN_2v1767513 [Rhizophagus irregularis DAOM 181602=DAOM 197198]
MDVALESIIPSRSKNFEKKIIVIFMVTSQTTMMNGNQGKLIVILKELDASSKEEKQEEITLPSLPPGTKVTDPNMVITPILTENNIIHHSIPTVRR